MKGVRQFGLLLAGFFVLAGVAISLYFYITLADTARFRDRFITRKYEGSLSEDLGFLAALTTEASKEFNFASSSEKYITEQIRSDLLGLKVSLEALKPLLPGRPRARPLHFEEVR